MYSTYQNTRSNNGGPKYSQGVPCPAPPMSMNVSTGHPFSSNCNPSIVGSTAPWSTGLCHCCDDPANCLVTAFCPCITFAQIAELVTRGEVGCGISGTIYALVMGLTGCACLYSCLYRSRLRGQYDLEESPFADCLVHFCCEPCALCQEYRELKIRGFDMGIGWQANMDRQKRGMTLPPQVGTMMR